MIEVGRTDAETSIQTPAYRLVARTGERRLVQLDVPSGRPVADLVLLSSAHPAERVDELVEIGPIEVGSGPNGEVVVSQQAVSTIWQRVRAELTCRPDHLVYQATFWGSAALGEVLYFESGERDATYLNRRTLSGFWRPARARDGWLASRSDFPKVFSPAPNGAGRTHFWFGERATNHPSNEPGFWGGDWFFTPSPFAYALGGDGRWLLAGLGPSLDELSFVRFDYRGGSGWGLGLTYDGEKQIDGEWSAPTVVLIPAGDEYAGLAAYHDWLEAEHLLPHVARESQPWWREPIWCGWGEQVAREGARRANELSTRANYERWLAVLERHGVRPGIVVIDDRWQAHLGGPEPSRRWPALVEFIEQQHAAGRRVLLWHNVWEVERPGELPLISRGGEVLRGAFGYPMWDPTTPDLSHYLRESFSRLLAPPPRGLGADGLKLDITHSTPGGPDLELRGHERGNGLLRRLLKTTYEAAKDARPDALIESHAANPYFRDACDVLRLNDVFTDRTSVVAEMEHRSRVARAAGFDLIDTDCWAMPSRAALVEYVEAQPSLGIPALYYATRVDRSQERLRDDDYRRIAGAWARYRATL